MLMTVALCCFETGSGYVALVGVEHLSILLARPLQCWDTGPRQHTQITTVVVS